LLVHVNLHRSPNVDDGVGAPAPVFHRLLKLVGSHDDVGGFGGLGLIAEGVFLVLGYLDRLGRGGCLLA
jgi:hypothetical protein